MCLCLAAGTGAFLAVSCGGGRTELSAPALEPGPEELGETSSGLAAAANQSIDETRDPVLAAYRDPAFRDMVVAFFRVLTGSEEIAEAVLANAAANEIPPALAFALCWEESRFNPRAHNRNRNETVDRGLFQLNSRSFPDLDIDDFYNPGINARYGLAHLSWCLNTAGTEVAGLAMYNAGSTRVRSAGTPKMTLDYISRVLKQQRKIEEQFAAEYSRVVSAEVSEREPEESGRTPFRLSLLTPLGR